MYSFPECDVAIDEEELHGFTTKDSYLGVVIEEPNLNDPLEQCNSFEVMIVYPYEEKNELSGGTTRGWYTREASGITLFGDPSEPMHLGISVIWHVLNKNCVNSKDSSDLINVSRFTKVAFEAMKVKAEIDISFADTYTTIVEYVNFPKADLGHFNSAEYKKALFDSVAPAQERYEKDKKERELHLNYAPYEWRKLATNPVPDEDIDKIEYRIPWNNEKRYIIATQTKGIAIEGIDIEKKIEWRYI